jgi:alpha-beta hydrolase superfamily lysophospholipase
MIILLIMFAVLLLVVAGTLVLVAYALLCPPRMTDGKALYLLKRLSPSDMGMQFENVSFVVRDHHTGRALRIAGWWIPHPAGGDKTVVLIHGYADAKVGALAWAPTWRQLGFHILAADLRAHGESEGKYVTSGVFERYDMDQVINQFRAAHFQQTRRLVLFGTSMGAAVALATADLRDDVAALVIDCPAVHHREGAKEYVQLLNLPLPSMLPTVFRIATWISGANFDEVQQLQLIAHVKCPVMLIQAGDDHFVPPDGAKLLHQALTQRPPELGAMAYWMVENASHLMALAVAPDEYLQRVGQFLNSVSPEFASDSPSAIS